MIVKCYSIFDGAAKIYTQPFCCGNDEVAIRHFATSVNNIEHPIGAHPGDYTLFGIGTYDDQTANMQSEVAVKLVNGLEIRASQVVGDPDWFDQAVPGNGGARVDGGDS